MDNSRELRRVNRTPFDISDRRRLTFYAAVWSSPAVVFDDGPDGKPIKYRESILPPAFDTALKNSPNVVADIDHDKTRTFASTADGTLYVQPDPHGLFCSCWVPDTELGNSIIRDINAGKLTGCSFHARFLPSGQVWRTGGDMPECEVVEFLQLVDVCITGMPAYQDTDVMVRTRHPDKTKAAVEVFRFRKLQLKK